MANDTFPTEGSAVLGVSDQPLTTISYRRRKLEMYPVQKHELEILCSGYNSMYLALAGIFVGATITLWVTVESVSLPPDSKRLFVDSLFGALVATAICGVMAIRDYMKSKGILRTIRSETVEVVVEQRP